MLAIPTALSICKVETSLLMYAIEHSLHFLKFFRSKSIASRNLKIYMKVSLMRVECELKQKKINIFEINKVFDEIEEILSQSEK